MKRQQIIVRNGIQMRRGETEQGCQVERYRLRGMGGSVIEHVTLWTELRLEEDRKELVLR